MRETVPSSALATQTEPCPIATATGLRPTSTWPTTRERCGSITATESGGTGALLCDGGSLDPRDDRRLEPRIVVEDGSLEALELIVRLEPELLVQQPPPRAVDLERVCLAAAAIEGQYQLARRCSRSGCLRTSESSSGTSSACRPSARSASTRASRRPAAAP